MSDCWHSRPDQSAARTAAAASSTTRARASRSASVSISVCVTVTLRMQIVHVGGVGVVDHVAIEQVAVPFGDGAGRRVQAEFGHHLGGRPLDGAAGDDRRDRNDRRAAGVQRGPHARQGQDRLDADERVGRADHHGVQRRIGEQRQKLRDAARASPSNASSRTTGSQR